MKKAEHYSAEYKAAVALAALRADLPLLELAAKYRVHPTLVKKWEHQAREGLAATFSNEKSECSPRKSPWDTKVSTMDSRLSPEERYYFSCPSGSYECPRGKGDNSSSPA